MSLIKTAKRSFENLTNKIGRHTTIVKLLDFPIDHPLLFSSQESRERYTNKKTLQTFTNLQYQQIDSGVIELNLSYTQARTATYLLIHNVDYEDKVFYCRKINDPIAISPNNCKIYYEIDRWLTDMFEISFADCMIERESLSENGYTKAKANPFDRSILELTTKENLPITKEFENKSYYKLDDLLANQPKVTIKEKVYKPTDLVICLQCAQSPDGKLMNTDDKKLEKQIKERIYKIGQIITSSQVSGGSQGGNPPASGKDDYNIPEMVQTWNNSKAGGLALGAASALLTEDLGNKMIPVLEAEEYDEIEEITKNATVGALMTAKTLVLPFNKKGFEILQKALDRYTIMDKTRLIIGLYILPAYFISNVANGKIIDNLNKIPYKVSIRDDIDPKLNTFPFSYLRLYSPDGSIKELQKENFTSILGGDSWISFYFGCNMHGVPVQFIAPYNYNFTDLLNWSEVMKFNGFPNVPYMTDGFYQQVAQEMGNANTPKSRSVLRQQDLQANQQLELQSQKKANVVAKGWSLKTGLTNALFGDKHDPHYNQQMRLQNYEKEQLIDKSNAEFAKTSQEFSSGDANTRLGILNTSINGNLFNGIKPQNICDEYHPGSLTGFENIQMDALTFRIQQVFLNENVLKAYGKYFELQGYASGRIGIPRVMNFVRNSGQQPHFKDNLTYVKTSNAIVNAKSTLTQSYVTQLFNTGAQFLNGDNL